ncbi:uncharacterized protein LOC131941458 [Physella acuta]|uniref:uncharacterized protein LOC131941458 n=1 Tax=Physella acuta TaxID=109671 RepID=UPI0027DC59F4|nr:uncharacterized protein LOC131941458 [Physella acuta]XP_059156713.1 uncharacterized protein LOC131941458 [Physella acuta]XP_059156714.1 uncharacterized protein LOC131941458 [Physella acuta]
MISGSSSELIIRSNLLSNINEHEIKEGKSMLVDGEFDNDNTVSEELSRFSSPSHSQSSSCTSITNPFYDGPPNLNEGTNSHLSYITNAATTDKMAHGNKKPTGSTSHDKINAGEGTSTTVQSSHTNRVKPVESEEKVLQRVIITWDLSYLVTCQGFIQFVQLVMTMTALVCLVSAGEKDGGLLNLPLSWHFRIMIFVLVLTLLVTVALLFGNITSLVAIFGFEWTFFDMIVYSLFAFLYLVGSSLVASAFDFYEKMKTDVSKETISQLVTSVILGYLCMLLHGLTAFISYRKWKIQYRLYQRRKLIEEDEIDL